MEPSDLALLAVLDALLQEESVTKAARRVGLSTPAMSHALAKIRERLQDPILVRAGRSMVLTPRAANMRPKVRAAIVEASKALAPEKDVSPHEFVRSFVVHATDHVLTVMGVDLDRIVHAEAPGISLRFVPNTADDPTVLRDGSSDLAIGIYPVLPPEIRTRPLITDRFVCVVRQDHPTVKDSLSLEQYLQLEHVQVAPRGKPGGIVDDVLAEKGYTRKVVRGVPFFLSALRLTAMADYVLTISERMAKLMAPSLGLKIYEPPIPLRPYTLKLVWHPKYDGDAAHQWLREAFLRAAKQANQDIFIAEVTPEKIATKSAKK